MKMDFKHGTEKFFKVIFEGITSMSLVKTDEDSVVLLLCEKEEG